VLVYRLRLNQDERTRNHQLRVDLVDPDGCTGYLSHPAPFRTWITQVASTVVVYIVRPHLTHTDTLNW
jgi:hypothetical protein